MNYIPQMSNHEELALKNDLSQQAEILIRNYAFGSSITGFIPVPLIDMAGLIGIQRLMLYRLSRLYGIPFSKNISKIAITTFTSALTTTTASPIVGSYMLKAIPGIGTIAGGTSMAALGSTATYAVGKVFQQHFESGGTMENFVPEKAKQTFQKELEKGKALARKKQAISESSTR